MTGDSPGATSSVRAQATSAVHHKGDALENYKSPSEVDRPVTAFIPPGIIRWNPPPSYLPTAGKMRGLCTSEPVPYGDPSPSLHRPPWNPIWPTPKVETNGFTGFLDPENVGVATEIIFLSALVSKL